MLSMLKLLIFFTNVRLALAFSSSIGAIQNRQNRRIIKLHASTRKNSHSNNVVSKLQFSPSNTTTSFGMTTAICDPITYSFDESAFVEALHEELPKLQRFKDKAINYDTPYHMPWPEETIQYQDSILPQSRNLLQQQQRQCTENASTEEDRWSARFLLLGAAALYGTNFAMIKLLGDTMPVGISSTLRFGMAASVCMPWLVMNRKEDSPEVSWLGFEVGCWNAIGYIVQAIGLDTTEASKSAFICSLAVVVVPLLDYFAGKRLAARQWIGVILAVLGVAFLELSGETSLDGLSDGDILSLVQPFVFGIGFWRMERAMHKHPDEASRLTAAQLLAVFLASAGYCIWSIDSTEILLSPWMEWLTDPSLLFSLFWTGVITTALTIYMETLALKTLSAAETTLIFSTEPLWGTAFAAFVMGEQLGMGAGVGAFFILAACIYSSLGMDGILSLLSGPSIGVGKDGADRSQRGSTTDISTSTIIQQLSSLCTRATSLTTMAPNTNLRRQNIEELEERFQETIRMLNRKHR